MDHDIWAWISPSTPAQSAAANLRMLRCGTGNVEGIRMGLKGEKGFVVFNISMVYIYIYVDIYVDMYIYTYIYIYICK